MSAIAGLFCFDGDQIDRSHLETISKPAPGNRIDALALPLGITPRQGPAGSAGGFAIWEGEGIGLGHAFASVTPESLAEQQPLVDPASGCVITFDGRLDNRDELRSALADDGRLIDQQADAAYVLAAYLRWESDFLNHLLGDFAFAIWNPQTKQLLLARDPLGQRPLYYSWANHRFTFASTLEQLVQDRSLSCDLDEEALPVYLYHYGALKQQTPYRAIQSLPGGHRLVVAQHRGKGGVTPPLPERYWQWPEEPPEPRSLSKSDVEEFRSLFAEAVRCRLRSHAPVGLLLSGGLDSSSIACMAGHLHEQNGTPPVHAYSFVFDKFESCDERRYIETMTSRYPFPFTPVLSDDCWTLSHLEQWLPVFSEPYFAPYDAMFYKALAQARADGVRTILMGHGGDPLLDGSPRYFADLLLMGRWRDLHRQTRAYAAATQRPYAISLVGNAVTPLLPPWVRRRVEYRHWPRLRSLIPPPLRSRHLDSQPRLYHGRYAWWYALRDQLAGFGQTPHEAHLDRLMRLFGLEVRQPFLDVRLLQFILRLPPDGTYSDGTRRKILRESLRDILPPLIRDRNDKASFLPLVDYGLRERRRSFVEALLDDSELARRGYVVPDPWQRVIKDYLRGGGGLYSVYWSGLVLEMWLRIQSGRLPPLDPVTS